MKKNILIGLGVLIVIAAGIALWFHYSTPPCDDFGGFCWGDSQAKVEKVLSKRRGIKSYEASKNEITYTESKGPNDSVRFSFFFNDGKLFFADHQPTRYIDANPANKSYFIRIVQGLQDQLIKRYGKTNDYPCPALCIDLSWQRLMSKKRASLLLFERLNYNGTQIHLVAHKREFGQNQQPKIIFLVFYYPANYTTRDVAEVIKSSE